MVKTSWIVFGICCLIISVCVIFGMKKQQINDAPDVNTNEPLQSVSQQVTDEHMIQSSDSETDKKTTQKQNTITEQEAEKLCFDVLGDRAQENDFPLSYRCIGTVYHEGKMYYVIHMSWLVNNSHFSYIGNCFVSSDGLEIYNGIALAQEYEITGLLWKKTA